MLRRIMIAVLALAAVVVSLFFDDPATAEVSGLVAALDAVVPVS